MPVQGLSLTLGEESALLESCHLYPSRASVFHIGKALYSKKEPLQLTHRMGTAKGPCGIFKREKPPIGSSILALGPQLAVVWEVMDP